MRRELGSQFYIPPTVRRTSGGYAFPTIVPSAYEWGWSKMPMLVRILVLGVFLSVISLTTPYWAYVETTYALAWFGLWHFCVDNHCSSIHDNLVPGREIPLWFHMTQVCFALGTVSTTIAMFVVASHQEGRRLRMPQTLVQMMVLMIFAGVLQMFTAIYTFLSYFEHTSFLYTEPLDVWYHASFFAGVGGALCHMVAGFALFVDEDISKARLDVDKVEERRRRKGYQPGSYASRYTNQRHVPQVKRLKQTSVITKQPNCRNIVEELYMAAAAQRMKEKQS